MTLAALLQGGCMGSNQYMYGDYYEGYTGNNAQIYFWFRQIPKEAPAIFALIMIALLGFINLAITCKTKAWFMLVVFFTAGLEVAGYACRIVMLNTPGYGAYVAMQALLIISPIFLALVDYIATGKLMKMANGGGRLKAAWVARGFFASDILCLAVQGGGAGLSSSTNASASIINVSKALLIAGIVLQLVFFTLFTCLTVYINLKRMYGLRDVKAFRSIFLCLYSSIGVLYIRSIFRLVEFSNGWFGFIATHESYFYCFDFLMVLLCFAIFTVFHFGFYMSNAQASLPVTAQQNQVSGGKVSSAGKT